MIIFVIILPCNNIIYNSSLWEAFIVFLCCKSRNEGLTMNSRKDHCLLIAKWAFLNTHINYHLFKCSINNSHNLILLPLSWLLYVKYLVSRYPFVPFCSTWTLLSPTENQPRRQSNLSNSARKLNAHCGPTTSLRPSSTNLLQETLNRLPSTTNSLLPQTQPHCISSTKTSKKKWQAYLQKECI